MKIIPILLLALLMPLTTSYSQKTKHEKDSISYVKQREMYPDTIHYSLISKGMKPQGTNFAYYESKDGYVFKSGDTLVLDQPLGYEYTFITIGDGTMEALAGNYNGPKHASASEMGSNIIIKIFTIVGTKNTGFKAVAKCPFVTARLNVLLENALKTKEVIFYLK